MCQQNKHKDTWLNGKATVRYLGVDLKQPNVFGARLLFKKLPFPRSSAAKLDNICGTYDKSGKNLENR